MVMGQAIENIAREDLSYIERAKLAALMVDEAEISPADIDTAFSCGKTERSRYLKIGRGVPDDILSFVGKAPGIGRPRWEKLVAQMAADETALPRMREALWDAVEKTLEENAGETPWDEKKNKYKAAGSGKVGPKKGLYRDGQYRNPLGGST